MRPASPETLLDHPALAGHTVYVHRGAEWERWIVRREGGLEPRPAARPQALHWRTPEGR